jgi:predicted kinase
MKTKTVIHFFGHSCTGKSTLEKILKDKLPGWYVVSYDKQKWQLAGYDRLKDISVVKEITKGLFEAVCKLGHSIISMAVISNEEEYLSYRRIAEEHGYKFISIELTAPKEIVLARFRERVENAKRLGTTLSVIDEKVFLENQAQPFFVPENTPSFDTSVLESDDVANKVLALLQ